MNVRVSPQAQFTAALQAVAVENKGNVDEIIAQASNGKVDLGRLRESGASPALEKAALALQGAVEQLNNQWNVTPKSLPEWYAVVTGRTLGVTVEATYSAAQITRAIAMATPHFADLEAAVGKLAQLGHSRSGVANWEASVAAHHGTYARAVDAIIEQFGPIDTARRAGQLSAPEAARAYEQVLRLSVCRNAVRQMGLVY
jgi:hypothetical protein